MNDKVLKLLEEVRKELSHVSKEERYRLLILGLTLTTADEQFVQELHEYQKFPNVLEVLEYAEELRGKDDCWSDRALIVLADAVTAQAKIILSLMQSS